MLKGMKKKLALFTAAVMTATAVLPAVDPGMTVSAKTQMTYAITGEQFEAITGTTGAELLYAHGGCIYCDAADADTAIDPEMKKGLRLVQPIGGVTATGGTTITEQINVNNGFSVAYSVYMGKSSGVYGSHKINYGDGFVFGVKQNKMAAGGTGGGLGYEGITNSFAVEYDTHQGGNDILYDPTTDPNEPDQRGHVGLDLNGVMKHTDENRVKLLYCDHKQYCMMYFWVDYDAANHKLYITASMDNKTKPSDVMLAIDVDLAQEMGTSEGYMFFSSGTAALAQDTRLTGLYFKDEFDAANPIDFSKTYDLTIGKHVHEWEYSANDNQLKATCKDSDNKHTPADQKSLTLTVSAASQVYYAKDVKAKVGTDAETAAWKEEFGADSIPAIKYVGTGSTQYPASTTLPTAPGTYKVVVTTQGKTAEKSFTILERVITLETPAAADVQPTSATVSSVVGPQKFLDDVKEEAYIEYKKGSDPKTPWIRKAVSVNKTTGKISDSLDFGDDGDGKEYKVRVVAEKTNGDEVISDEITVQTPAKKADTTVAKPAASNVQPTTATVESTVGPTANLDDVKDTAYIEYKDASDPKAPWIRKAVSVDKKTGKITGDVDFGNDGDGKEYKVRVVAEKTNGDEVISDEITVQTPAKKADTTVAKPAASNVQPTTATVESTVGPVANLDEVDDTAFIEYKDASDPKAPWTRKPVTVNKEDGKISGTVDLGDNGDDKDYEVRVVVPRKKGDDVVSDPITIHTPKKQNPDNGQNGGNGTGDQNGGNGNGNGTGDQNGGNGNGNGTGDQNGGNGNGNGTGDQNGGNGSGNGTGDQNGGNGSGNGTGDQNGGNGSGNGTGDQNVGNGNGNGNGIDGAVDLTDLGTQDSDKKDDANGSDGKHDDAVGGDDLHKEEADTGMSGPDSYIKGMSNGKTLAENEMDLDSGLTVTQKGNTATITWGKVPGADRYTVYGTYCGDDEFEVIKTVKGSGKCKVKVKKLQGKKLDLTRNYKFYVVAEKVENGKVVELAKGITGHIVGRKNTAYTNIKNIKLKKQSVTIKKGKKAKVKAKLILVDKSKKMLSDHHAKAYRYRSSDIKIATVDKSGKIKGVAQGQCYVWVYAKNGYAKKVKVTVQ